MKPLTKMTTFSHISNKGALGTTLVRLMMFVNDLGLCNDALEQWHKYEDEPHKKRASGAKMYFVRLMIGHIYEALKVINDINTKSELRNAVGQCDQRTQELFNKVAPDAGNDQFKRMGKVRNNITFHYLHDKIEPALASLAKKFPNDNRPISIGEKSIQTYFEPSDRIIDNAVLREIFEVPEEADLSAEIEKVIENMQLIGEKLATFAGLFIFHHVAKS